PGDGVGKVVLQRIGGFVDPGRGRLGGTVSAQARPAGGFWGGGVPLGSARWRRTAPSATTAAPAAGTMSRPKRSPAASATRPTRGGERRKPRRMSQETTVTGPGTRSGVPGAAQEAPPVLEAALGAGRRRAGGAEGLRRL